ncbi:tRNA nucleotidyltransferase/poly(A) polymerase family protein [Leptolyngbya boryana NIES-2135]|jgi:tRNA nucleotidyltransferase (CCA-adding enzyme)|uniref:tRNA nucleotidyltransferase/poly(A) polymerase family protein n=1 Tax=Leptolyngbya boryana NIES-2135 TaxID=1973484 RepID=A0A1Z4J9E1_LEPBY|nr:MULTISPECIES: CBS domain-containing protein [Leptolyngbya]BAY53331.1 tRNA nucleotidyltransferase/poly(A) polymerase family protein [Leptolyngbya boryana NIES-2135]MBD2366803.1 CBS domain-containing protein [Leptolyngbya sp. FACHB-161]MBD2373182.1 CBS domain-containing protein [Leptolyngbya sp. FACHB-238]MBD2397583.1 CBS domain-containing protein [Leptolyngbya sp. FACHB-239]MBD2404727.1 CBS domain-containing protein [Leptolyngbya sp. FACHB-402]
MDVILCHTTADFDTLGAAVGVSRLRPQSRIVLSGGAHPPVRDFLALHRDEYPMIERRSVKPESIRSITVVDAQMRDRLGSTAVWLDLPQVEITLYDHHVEVDRDISAEHTFFDAVGATTTIVVEQLQAEEISITPIEATVMALGIHVDTGSLTFDHATARDAMALGWLMQQGASLKAIAQYVDPGLSPQLQALLSTAMKHLHTQEIEGNTIAWVMLETEEFVPGLSSLASSLMELTESDALLLGHRYSRGTGEALTVIGRSNIDGTNLNDLFQPQGGGHAKAASLSVRDVDAEAFLDRLIEQFKAQIPKPLSARELMSSPVRTIRPETTIEDAQRILLRYGHSGLSIVNQEDQLVGVISRRDLDIALHHGFSHAPVKGYMASNLKTITPETSLPEIEALMVTYDIGRLPVLEQGNLVGIVTRTDVLRQLHQGKKEPEKDLFPLRYLLRLERFAEPFQKLLTIAAQAAAERGWHLYLVGGAVRDLLLADPSEPVALSDIDLVVDGFHQAATVGAGVELARSLQTLYPQARLEIHGKFQTAALLWHNDTELDSLWIDIATARTEFYPYPAANPEVEASSIRQDLYRRDFTVNALALRLTNPRSSELLDFFGGVLDLRSRQIRVLHANSFIEDPTRIYRAVRFAVRLGFVLEPQTEGYIRHAIDSGVYEQRDRIVPALQTRLKSELKYILQAPYWRAAIRKLADLDALTCIHPMLKLDAALWRQMRLADWLQRCDMTIPHWQILLEVLIAKIDDRANVAQALQLPADAIKRLANLAEIERQLEQLPHCEKTSQMVQLLKLFSSETLILVAVRSSRTIRRLIWTYFSRWSLVKAPIDGTDLKALGYKPGKQFKQMLDDLLAATLDGEISDRAQAEAFLHKRYPLT